MRNRDRVAVVTGASAGVGRATVLRLARAGWHIGLIARGAEPLEALAREVRALGAEALPLPCDVADAAAVEAAAGEAERVLGPIDAWINNAMVTLYAPIHDVSPEEFRRVTEVCYLGYVHGTMAALRRMRGRNRPGRILQVGSALAYHGIPLQGAYSGAKHAIQGFTDSLRAELRQEGSRISVTEVHLPAVNTPQFAWARARLPHRPRPMGRAVTPEAAARAIEAALIHGGREHWLGGAGLMALLGPLMPGLADRYLARAAPSGQMDPAAPPRPAQAAGNLFEPRAVFDRLDGPYAAEATDRALRLSGGAARALAGGAALALACGVGLALGRRRG